MLEARFIAFALIGLQSIFPAEAGNELRVEVGVSVKGQESKDHSTSCKKKCICNRKYSPVCGSDGKTYGNGCSLDCENCLQTRDVTVASQGECPKEKDCKEKCICLAIYLPVCGTDGKTYASKCAMECENCQQTRGVKVASRGECPKEKVCPCVCPKNYDPVCGTDGKTYSNKCVMECESCKQGTNVTVASHGKCPEEEVCPCVCPKNYDPVCGTDGKTYSNKCVMECESCKQGTNVTVASYGECPKEEVCPCICPKNYDPVCGTDGKTYSNKCVMECESCKQGTNVTVASYGECPKEKDCQFSCPETLAPVCGSDGITYDNKCILKHISCKQGTSVTIVSQGECPEEQGQLLNGASRNLNKDCEKKCVCNRDYSPVCGSDGKTYGNWCSLDCENCRQSRSVNPVSAVRSGECPKENTDCEKKCVCNRDYSPVCGSDGKTYGNWCSLDCENCRQSRSVNPVSAVRSGECPKE